MKVCFVGAGSIGKRHINNLRHILNKKGETPEIHLLRSSHSLKEGINCEKEKETQTASFIFGYLYYVSSTVSTPSRAYRAWVTSTSRIFLVFISSISTTTCESSWACSAFFIFIWHILIL